MWGSLRFQTIIMSPWTTSKHDSMDLSAKLVLDRRHFQYSRSLKIIQFQSALFRIWPYSFRRHLDLKNEDKLNGCKMTYAMHPSIFTLGLILWAIAETTEGSIGNLASTRFCVSPTKSEIVDSYPFWATMKVFLSRVNSALVHPRLTRDSHVWDIHSSSLF